MARGNGKRGGIGRRGVLGAAAVLAALPLRPALARRVFPEDEALDYQALRHDQVIGHRRLEISRASGDLVLRQEIDLRIGPEASPRHRFLQRVEETWHEGWLVGLVSDTEEDGRFWRVRAERRDGIFGGLVNGFRFTASGYLITTTLWHRDTPTQEALLDVIDAEVKLVRSRTVGDEQVRAAGKTVTARHYLMYGQVSAHLWYDEDCRLVRIQAPLRDGSEVAYELV